MEASHWLSFAVALGLGLLMGLERERSKGEGLTRRPAGIRTFALVTLLGAIAAYLGGVVLLAIATAATALLAALAYAYGQDDDPGLTTMIGLLAAPLIGGLAISDRALASALSVAIAVLFAAKMPLHHFVRGVLTEDEVNDGLIFAVATLVIWPQLPDTYLGPFDSLNPHKLWLLIILVLVIGACGHIATRSLGHRYGLPVAGLASGFVSSTATIGSMAAQAQREPATMAPAVAGAMLSTVATFLEMAVILTAISQPVLRILLPALAAGGLVAAFYALAFTLRSLNAKDVPETDGGRAFSMKVAFALTAAVAVSLVAAAALKQWLGESGIALGAALVGFADTHSAAIAVASLASSGNLAPQAAILPIVAAMTTNALMKIIVAASTGPRAFILRLVPGLILSMAAAWLLVIVTLPK